MPTLFNKPPLIEAIAEFRWSDPVITGDLGKQAFAHQANEAFYTALTGAVSAVGFPMVERLVPPGYGVTPGSVTVRFRTGRDGANNLLQAGPGVFTVNALPPYKGWSDFEPVLRQGLELMLAARQGAEKELPISSASLRYMNGFSSHQFWEGKVGSYAFARKLGFALTLPEAMKALGPIDDPLNVAFQVKLPPKDDLGVVVSWQEAVANAELVSMLDIHLTSTTPLAADIEVLMAFMKKAQGVNHETFMGLIHGIEGAFEPQESF
jgi:uncharacterized protein (TIGR04255 family)